MAEWAAVGANILGSGLSFLGGQSANAANMGFANNQLNQQMMLAQQQMQFQREAATQGIQWRVADAKAAGISPLVALGAPTFNPNPVMIGGANPMQENALAGVGSGLSAMGQDLSRAAMAAQTEKTRAETIIQAETMRNNSAVAQSEAERNMADAALARKKAEMIGTPPMPSAGGATLFVPGQGNSGATGVTKLERSKGISAAAGVPSAEAAVTPAVKGVVMPNGGIDPQPSLGTSVGATGETWGWSVRNRLNPPAGMHVGWDGAWYPDKGSTWWDRPFGYSRNTPGKYSWPFDR